MLNPQLYRLTHNYWIIEQKMRMKYLRFSADLQRLTRMKKKKRQPILLVCRLLSE